MLDFMGGYMNLKPIILVRFDYSSLSGGYRRLYEILKRGKSEGIDYIVITDSKSCENAVKIFPDFMEILGQYKVFKKDFKENGFAFPIMKQVYSYKIIVDLALFISRVAKEEDADLIINPGEGTFGVLTCYLASVFCSKPWTAIFQPTAYLLQPSYSLGPLNPLNVFKHMNKKASINTQSLISKVGLSIDLLSLLKISERTVILAVSNSVVEDFSFMNPRIRFITITPGNGIDVGKFPKELTANFNYHGVFFARLVPEKGIFDLIEIWKPVVRKMPDAKLAICGIIEEKEIVEKFLKEVSESNLSHNVEFLGQQEEAKLLNIVANSYLTVYPSYVDSFSLVALESLGCGTPVVAYDIPAIRHNFSKSKAVFRVPIGDKEGMANMILHVLTKMERKSLSIEAKKFATLYDWDNVVKAEKEAYFKVIIEYSRSKKSLF
jgi:glycosyltransferase involved in cell wall biosynthesis